MCMSSVLKMIWRHLFMSFVGANIDFIDKDSLERMKNSYEMIVDH